MLRARRLPRAGIRLGLEGRLHHRAWRCSGSWTGPRTEHTIDLGRLAALDAATFARVKFQFPAGTRFPSLPVDADDAWPDLPAVAARVARPGPELVVALGQGATITGIEGVYFHGSIPTAHVRFWSSPSSSTRSGPARQRARRWNSWRRKPATASTARPRRPSRATSQRRATQAGLRYPRQGEWSDLDESKITQPLIAALTTGLLRACALRDHCHAAGACARLHRHHRRLAEYGYRGRGARRACGPGREVLRELARRWSIRKATPASWR